MTFFARSSEWTRAHKDASEATPFAGGSQHYFAFLSYSHQDQPLADWLEDQLEKFRVPRHLVGRITDYGAVPRKLTPIFRDLKELPASDDLGTEIKAALSASRFLVVLCSPGAARSRWANAEIEAFKRAHPEGGVFAAILSGEPFASDTPGREEEECLPHALRFKYDRRGRPTAKRAEPLAADLREPGEARRLGFLKLVAGMLGVGLDDLVRRDEIRRQRRLAAVTAASIAGMVVTSGLAVTAITARDEARDQRREAESLVGFMLGDLKGKLEPIGRLDALDGVGSRVLEYYHKQDTADLPDAALLQRSKALTLMADVANSRGDLDGALRLFHEAMAGTAEAIRRDPKDPQRLFDHAQNVFWTADIALRRGDSRGAERAFRQYKTLATQMVALEPDNMKWRMETQYADANLGILLFNQRRFEDSAAQFENALKTIEAIATADPGNSDYQKSLAESLAWLADAKSSQGRISEATALRERDVALLERLFKQSGGDVDYGQMLVPAHTALARLYFVRGRLEPAIAQVREAVAHSQQLLDIERTNSQWLDFSANARLDLARYYLGAGRSADAEAETDAACGLARQLVAKDRGVAQWRALQRDCVVTQLLLALASGDFARAGALSTQAVAAAGGVKTSDPIEDGYGLAKALRLAGDSNQRLGNAAAARADWTRALAAIPRTTSERPSEMSERRSILQRLGRSNEARDLQSKLASMGYREPGLEII
jgi:tetratricopeptide (TPR) repeat protein